MVDLCYVLDKDFKHDKYQEEILGKIFLHYHNILHNGYFKDLKVAHQQNRNKQSEYVIKIKLCTLYTYRKGVYFSMTLLVAL